MFTISEGSTLNSKTEFLSRDLLHADDANFVAHSEDLQLIMDHFSDSCDAFELRISLRKRKVMFTLPPGVPYKAPTILVKNTRLEIVDTFPYLESTISKDGDVDAEMFFMHSESKCSIW